MRKRTWWIPPAVFPAISVLLLCTACAVQPESPTPASPPLILAAPDYQTELVATSRGDGRGVGAEKPAGTATRAATPDVSIGPNSG